MPLATPPVSPSPGSAPSARAVSVESLLEPGDRPERVLYGRLLPGDGEQIVVHSSRDIGCPDRQDHLLVFAFDPALGDWAALFDGDLWPSASGPVIPDREDVSEPCRGAEELVALALTDLDRDGLEELTFGLATFDGGEPGPLLLEVLSFASGAAEPLYDRATVRGGTTAVLPDRVVIEQPTFPSRSGALWQGEDAPNGFLREAIAWDEGMGQMVVVERENHLFCLQGVVERASRDAVLVACLSAFGGGGGRQVTGFAITQETKVLPKEIGGAEKLRPGREVSVRAENLGLDEDDEVNPVAVEIVVLNQRHARTR